MQTTLVKLLLADDHVIIRRGLKVIIDNYFRRTQIFEADSNAQILKILSEETISHAILDMQLQDGNVLEIFQQLRQQYPHIRILVYTMNAEEIYGPRIIQMGAAGFLSKNSNESEIRKALELFFQGKEYVSSILNDRLIEKNQQKSSPLELLSEREMSVLNRLLLGESVKEISYALDLKATTVATYKARLFEKLLVTNIIDLRRTVELYEDQIRS